MKKLLLIIYNDRTTLTGSSNRSRGFTIVELLIVIVVIAILAAITIVAYNGVKSSAEDASMQSELSQANRKVLTYKVTNSETLPGSATDAGISAASGREYYYRQTADGKNYCLVIQLQSNPSRAWSLTSTDGSIRKGTCEGYVLVPGNAVLGTKDFWVMKYEAKNISGEARSQAANAPWTTISKADATSRSQAACAGCHLISDAEWMTIAGNIAATAANWSGGSVGVGYIYSGHSDNDSTYNALSASVDDNDGYSGTGNFAGQTTTLRGLQGDSQKRTLSLSNGEVIWDIAGNVWEWVDGTQFSSGQHPGISGESSYAWKEWTNAGLQWGALPASARPTALSAIPGLSNIGSWQSTQGIGGIYSNRSETGVGALHRGGDWGNGIYTGIFAASSAAPPTGSYQNLGFRTVR